DRGVEIKEDIGKVLHQRLFRQVGFWLNAELDITVTARLISGRVRQHDVVEGPGEDGTAFAAYFQTARVGGSTYLQCAPIQLLGEGVHHHDAVGYGGTC